MGRALTGGVVVDRLKMLGMIEAGSGSMVGPGHDSAVST